jgi:transposase InsO family protein
MKPNSLNLFTKKLTRVRVVPIISASVSWPILAAAILEVRIDDPFVEHYNYQRYHKSLNNLTPANVCFKRGHTILLERERIKRKTIALRRLQHQQQAA